MSSSETETLEILERAEQANPHFFRELVAAAKKMSSRRNKYSGDTDSYTNFIIMARILGQRVSSVFVYYKVIKLARDIVGSGDFDDESMVDTDHDEGNYSFISAGWRTRSPRSRLHAMLSCGNWVEVETLEELGVDIDAIVDEGR